MSPATAWLLVPRRLLDPPLVPTPDEARSRLRRELLRPEYHDQAVLQRLLAWMQRQLGRGLDAAGGSPALATFAAMVVLVLLLGALTWLLSRQRLSARSQTARRAVLTDEVITADELRGRARLALAEGRHEDALVDAFRAVAVRQVERGELDDTPGTTAHEVATALGLRFPDRRDDVHRGAALFDAVLYGDHPAGREQAEQVLGLDDVLAVAR